MSNYSAGQIVLPQEIDVVRPIWVEDLLTFHTGRIARQFVLHFNLTDFAMDMSARKEVGKGEYVRQGAIMGEIDQLATMREYLHQLLFDVLRCQSIYTYSLAGGLIASDGKQRGMGTPLGRELRGPALQRLYDASKALAPQKQGQPTEGQEIDLPDNVAETLKLLGHVLRQHHYDKQNTQSNNQGTPVRENPIAVIVDYAEKLIPFHLGEGQGDREQLQALEVVQRWALDPLIRKTDNIIILLTNNIGQIPAGVYDEGSGCRAIRVPLPDVHERESFIHFKMTRAKTKLIPLDTLDFGSTPTSQARQLARITQGMRLIDIDNLSRRVYVEFLKKKSNNPEQSNPMVTLKTDDVQRVKSEVIQAQSAQLLEIVPPTRGFNEIGGLESLKLYLSKRTALMRLRSHSPLVPGGLLLAGPPGTGKTIIAEALALESGFNLVKMRNIQDKWVGSSERNLELVLNLLKDLHPVIVFVDEIDQAMGQRDTGQSGDNGVGARMFARILEEMSNASNRGNILWVAATNRADIIDAALLRRFDRVVPLLVPDVHESCRIFSSMVNMIVKQSGGTIKVAYGGDLTQSGAKDVMGRPSPGKEDLAKFLPVAHITSEMGITGAGIEIIVRRAIELAYEEMLDSDPTNPDPGLDTLPLVELHHLRAAVHDFKPNYSRMTYDYQSLLAIRACNFYSVIPPLPESGVFSRIKNEDGRIDPEKLETEISEMERRLNNKKSS